MTSPLERIRSAKILLESSRKSSSAPVPLLDAVIGAARIKVVSSLASMLKKLGESNGLMPMDRLRIVRDIKLLLQQLGAGPVATQGESGDVLALRAIADGAHDGRTLAELYGMIQKTINSLTAAGNLDGAGETVAHDAITHWAELESQDA